MGWLCRIYAGKAGLAPCPVRLPTSYCHAMSGERMTTQDLRQLVAQREDEARQEIRDLHAATIAAEERLARLVVTRETLSTLLPSDSETPQAPPASPDPETQRSSSNGAQANNGHRRDDVGPPRARVKRPRIGAVSTQILVLLASAGRPMSAKEVALALGYASPTRGQVEGTRSKLLALVDKGKVNRPTKGLFEIAPSSMNGAASR